MNNLVVGYFYKEQLNLYGDNGNVEILKKRAELRGIQAEVVEISPDTHLSGEDMRRLNLVFMGGGPDSGQKDMYEDLLVHKGPLLKEYVEAGGVGLFICGSYQLLGRYYKSADGSVLKGLDIFDLYTEHFGKDKPRCIGNVVCQLSESLLRDPLFQKVNLLDEFLVGFENHGGRTYLGINAAPLGTVTMGYGNNSEDSTEGVLYKNCIGTYLHGPFLARNSHIADYLIAKAIGVDYLQEIDDSLIITAHERSKKLKQ